MIITVKMVQQECYKCSTPFAITEEKHTRCKEKGETMTCPNGHPQVFAKNELAEAKKKIVSQAENLAYWKRWCKDAEETRDHYFRRITSLRGHVTRLKKKLQDDD